MESVRSVLEGTSVSIGTESVYEERGYVSEGKWKSVNHGISGICKSTYNGSVYSSYKKTNKNLFLWFIRIYAYTHIKEISTSVFFRLFQILFSFFRAYFLLFSFLAPIYFRSTILFLLKPEKWQGINPRRNKECKKRVGGQGMAKKLFSFSIFPLYTRV